MYFCETYEFGRIQEFKIKVRMTVQDYLELHNKSFQVITENYFSDFNDIFESEKNKNWLVPIENKLDKLNSARSLQDIQYVIDVLKSDEDFKESDTDKLGFFTSKINSIVKVADRINNFKENTTLEDGTQLRLFNLFNTIKSTTTLSDFNYVLNKNLNSFKSHIFSVIKHCQNPLMYPVYYPFWQNLNKHVLKRSTNYDAMCVFYSTFPQENRTLAFGSYFGTLAKLLIKGIKEEKEINKNQVIVYLKEKVINLREYADLLDEINFETNHMKKYWIYSPGENAYKWDGLYAEGIMALGWDDLGNLTGYSNKSEIQQKLLSIYDSKTNRNNDATANYDFANTINVGDVIIVKKGRYELLGYGEVISDYYFDEEKDDYKHCRKVKWRAKGSWSVDHTLVLKTLTEITTYNSEKLIGKKYYEELLSIIDGNLILPTVYVSKVSKVLQYKKQIILQGPPGTGKTRLAKNIALTMLGHYNVNELQENEQFKLIQFHPSYTYEDFVRGIVAKPNLNGEGIFFEAENKILGLIAEASVKNFNESKKDSYTLSKENKLHQYFDSFKEFLNDEMEKNEGRFSLTKNVSLFSSDDENAFRYKGDNDGWSRNGNRMLYSDILQAYLDGNIERKDIKQNKLISGLARQHASYFVRVLNLFQDYLEKNNLKVEAEISVAKVELKNYVLIIDEINRANVSSVLGELIYALEYRGENVESIYKIGDSNQLILPPNLYIIGTMNTADRSVGHIDYAIRRRFAFVDVLPKNLESELKDDFKDDVFAKVASLFIENYDSSIDYSDDNVVMKKSEYMTADFDPKDVWLGHSYFIQHYEKNEIGEDIKEKPVDFTFRIRYEIKPILEEYIKDGILKESARSIINSL